MSINIKNFLTVFILFFSLLSIAQPNTISGLKLWFSSDALVTHSGGFVSGWGDLSGNNNNASQLVLSQQPGIILNVLELNNKPVIRFDGINDFMSFSPLNVRTVFFVVKHATGVGINQYNTLLGNSFSYHWHGNVGNELFRSYPQTANIFSGQGFVNNVQIAPSAMIKPTQYSVLTVRTSADHPAERITGDYPPDNFASYWDGDFAEIIIYDSPLSDADINLVNEYLFNKYAPSVSLGADINQTNSFCPITLDASTNFTSYTWSTGASTSSISVTTSGTYSVVVTDVFGRLSTDEIVVNFPTFVLKNDTTVCYNTEYRWNTLLNNTDFDFAWSNADTDSLTFFYPTTTTTLSCTITDSFTCSYTTPVITITVDDFSQTASLGPDIALCEGNTIGLITSSYVSSYNWMPGNLTTSVITITNSGTYTVEAFNSIGCEVNDDIVVTIAGSVPTADFIFSTTCFGTNMQFTQLANAPIGNSIVSYTWNFGEPTSGVNNNAIVDNPTHNYADDGNYSVSLEVETEIGCKQNITKIVTVYPIPIADFVNFPACANASTQFKDLSDGLGYPISQWNWGFGDFSSSTNTANVAEPFHKYVIQNTYLVSLTVSTLQGCKANISKSIYVNPSPIVDFINSSLCLGSVITYTNTSQMPFPQTIQNWQWNFGDGQIGFAPIELHTYSSAGNYLVSLAITSSIGCTHILTKTVLITHYPQANYTYSNNCLNKTIFFEDKSVATSSNINSWKWKFNTSTISTLSTAAYLFNTVGNKNIELTVSNSNGCESKITKTIQINSLPIASFSYTPNFVTPGESILFNNFSQNATSYTWLFGNSFSSNLIQPTTLFPDSGRFVVSLVAKDLNGCKDSISKSIEVLFPKLDLGIFSLKAEVLSDNFLDISTDLINYGTRPITNFKILSSVNSESTIREKWTGDLKRGQLLPFKFNSSVKLDASDTVNAYVCVEIDIVNDFFGDDNLSNNKKCISFRADRFIVLPGYPNPTETNFTLPIILPEDGEISIEVYNDLGQLVFDKYVVVATKGLNSITVDINYLDRGVYFYKVSFKDKVARNKFMITK